MQKETTLSRSMEQNKAHEFLHHCDVLNSCYPWHCLLFFMMIMVQMGLETSEQLHASDLLAITENKGRRFRFQGERTCISKGYCESPSTYFFYLFYLQILLVRKVYKGVITR